MLSKVKIIIVLAAVYVVINWLPINLEKPMDASVKSWPNGQTAEIHIPDGVWETILKVANKNDVDPRLMVAIAYSETQFRGDLCSTAGSCGLFQIPNKTFQQYAKPDMNILSPGDNTYVAAQIMKELQLHKSFMVSEQTFVDRFIGNTHTRGKMWNQDEQQARFVWDYFQALKRETNASWGLKAIQAWVKFVLI